MRRKFARIRGLLLVLALPIAGCSAVGAGAGGYAGYELGCDDDSSREECAAATGAGAVGGAVVGEALD